MTLSTVDFPIIEGLVSPEYPYYLVYPTTYNVVEAGYTHSYRVVRIWLSSDPLEFVDRSVDLSGTRFYEFRRSQYLVLVDADYSGSWSAPADGDVFYTSSREAAAPSLNIDRQNDFNYAKTGFIAFIAIAAAVVLARVLVGGK